ncbi:MAG: DUF3570 domain-containing protein [Ignavibacteria bacterium]|nr:DUF3570 domain-containing protein [Ignavibacteria bacterium]
MTDHKAGVAAVVKYYAALIPVFLLCVAINLFSQDIPESELDARINSYFDNFGVTVIYPQVSFSKKLSDNNGLSLRYLSDIISSASMKSWFKVDGITSATTRNEGGADDTPDEWRHEFGASFSQKISSGVLSLNGQYSTEHDYSSKTLSVTLSYPFAKKNTIIQTSVLFNFDKIFPQTRTWTKEKNTKNVNIGLTQIFSKNIITQFDASYIEVNGYMLDGYQVIRIINSASTYQTLEPVAPDKRIRRAIGVRTNIGITKTSSLQLGYRYYWDTWDIQSHTISAAISKNFSQWFSATLDLRHYLQTRAFFFKPQYFAVEQFMTVDSKLNSGFSDQVMLSLALKGRKSAGFPFFTNEKLSLTGSAGFYRRQNDSPDWFSHYNTLYAYLLSIGIRYNF